jgi:hypothetical protein
MMPSARFDSIVMISQGITIYFDSDLILTFNAPCQAESGACVPSQGRSSEQVAIQISCISLGILAPALEKQHRLSQATKIENPELLAPGSKLCCSSLDFSGRKRFDEVLAQSGLQLVVSHFHLTGYEWF